MSRTPDSLKYTLTPFGVMVKDEGKHRIINHFDPGMPVDPYRALEGLPQPWWQVSNRLDLFDFLWDRYRHGMTCDGAEAAEMLAKHPMVPMQSPYQVVKCNGVTVAESEFARNDEFLQGGDRSAKSDKDSSTEVTPYTHAGDLTNPAETFTKAIAPGQLFTDGGMGGIRADTTAAGKVPAWDVPEPEFGVVSTAAKNPHDTMCPHAGHPIAFFLGNDMSSRSLEGLTPLELGNAKEYAKAAGISRWVTVPRDPLAFWKTLTLECWVERGGQMVFPAEIGRMKSDQVRRPLQELVNNALRQGPYLAPVFQMTGTGVCPMSGDEFTLDSGDKIFIRSPQLGELDCTVTVVDWPVNRHFVPNGGTK